TPRFATKMTASVAAVVAKIRFIIASFASLDFRVSRTLRSIARDLQVRASSFRSSIRIMKDTAIWTIGHSTLSIAAFIEALASHDIKMLVDVRSFPGSKRMPHFNRSSLSESLVEAGIGYLHMPELGGRRPARKDSPNTAWQNASFRGYADYMETAP